MGGEGEGLLAESLGGAVLVVAAHGGGPVEDEVDLGAGGGEVLLGEGFVGGGVGGAEPCRDGVGRHGLGFAVGRARLPTRTTRAASVVGRGYHLWGIRAVGVRGFGGGFIGRDDEVSGLGDSAATGSG
ncbi:hypothetical protein E4N62_17250 [Streptomyces sp. MNU76]|nr:hypothetical protein [Streptomyces sp. MNU76]